MKVFISSSGDRSNKVARAISDWLPSVIQAVKPWGWLLLALNITVTFVAARWTFDWLFAKPALAAQTEFAEFTDNQYNYIFQHPTEWKMKTPPEKPEGNLGETRVFIQGPRAAIAAMVVNIGKTLSKSQYDSNPNSDTIVKALIDLTVEQVYKKMSKTLNASRMTVLESKVMPSKVGVKFYVSTLQFIDDKPPVSIIGTHLVPFDKPHMIVFLMSVVADKKMKEDQHLYNKIFKSFRLVGEAP